MSCLEKISPQEIKRAKVLVVRRFRLEMIPSQDLRPYKTCLLVPRGPWEQKTRVVAWKKNTAPGGKSQERCEFLLLSDDYLTARTPPLERARLTSAMTAFSSIMVMSPGVSWTRIP